MEYYNGWLPSSSFTTPKAILFTYPITETANIFLSPEKDSHFAFFWETTDFEFTVGNSGNMGSDTYDLVTDSSWNVALYADDGTTLLTDTDTDGIIDTGLIAPGDVITVIAKVLTPESAQVGDGDNITLTATSSLDITKNQTASLTVNVPANFVNVFEGENDTYVSFMTVNNEIGQNFYQFSEGTHARDIYHREMHSVEQLPNGNYIYVWERTYTSTGEQQVKDIEYVIVGKDGNAVSPLTRLTDNSAAILPMGDTQLSVAAAPDGTVGLFWQRYMMNELDEYKQNFYFATLDIGGNLMTGPRNITNNTVWTAERNWQNSTLSSTDDNYFIIGWDDSEAGSKLLYYSILNTSGEITLQPTLLPYEHFQPIFNRLNNGKIIITTRSAYNTVEYAIIDSSGDVLWGPVVLPHDEREIFETPDAVFLPNGEIAIAWNVVSVDGISYSDVVYVLLNKTYEMKTPATYAHSTNTIIPLQLSVTTDIHNNIIMTWAEGASLVYALGSPDGSFITTPMIYYQSDSVNQILVTQYGQGNAPWENFSFAPENDDFNFAEDILVLSHTNELITLKATSAEDDPVVSECGLGQGQATVWYKYTPTVDSAISTDTLEASYDTFVAVWTGTRGDLTLVACNDDVGNTKQSAVAFRVQNGTTYYIEVGQP